MRSMAMDWRDNAQAEARPVDERRAPDFDAPEPGQRLVIAVEVRVAVDQNDFPGAREGRELLSQGSITVARRGDEGVRLHQHDQALALAGEGGSFLRHACTEAARRVRRGAGCLPPGT